MAKRRKGRSAAFMKALRKKYRLGEYSGAKGGATGLGRAVRRSKKKRKNLGYPGNSPKEEFYKSIGVPELGFEW